MSISSPKKVYWHGRPATGKTAYLTEQLRSLLARPVRPDRILVLVPQQAHTARFRERLAELQSPARGEPFIGTFYHFAQREVALFFPLIAKQAGFVNQQREPTFLNIEATHYCLSRLLESRPERRAIFSELRLTPARLVAQISDAMNKLAEAGLPLDVLSQRLAMTQQDKQPRQPLFDAAQQIAQAFRQFCLRHWLVDFSLLMTLFSAHLLKAPFYQDYVRARYRHLLVDNVEENVPIMHDFAKLVLEDCDSAILIEDDPGGLRAFLGSDPQSARTLRAHCDLVQEWSDAHHSSERPTAQFAQALMHAITQGRTSAAQPAWKPQRLDRHNGARYWTDMVRAVAEAIAQLRNEGIAPSEIAVLAPYVEDVLVFTLTQQLRQFSIGVQTLRPSRPLHEHPTARALIALARLAYPALRAGRKLTRDAVALALHSAIADLDPARAHKLAGKAFEYNAQALKMVEDAALWDRIGFRFREPFRALLNWMASYPQQRGDQPLDLFWQHLFVEVLAQPGFAMRLDRDAATVCYKLIASSRTFRDIFSQAQLNPADLSASPSPDVQAINAAWLEMLEMQLMPRQFAAERSPLQARDPNSVLLGTAYAWATSDLRARVQIWLDVQSNGWHQRIHQPLTHPFVLSRQWNGNQAWSDADELVTSRDMLARLCGSLAFRCQERILLASSQLTLKGADEAGMLAKALQRMSI